MFQYHPENPWRPVDWRWQRAKLFCSGSLKSAKTKEDEYTKAAISFQRSLQKCRSDYDRYALMEINPSLFFAWALSRRENDFDGPPKQYAVEARLLADESFEQIASKTGCSVETLEWYERLFFNVKPRLRHPDYIMTTVIGPSVHSGMAASEYDILWKVFGYLYGPIVLDSFIHCTNNRSHPASAEEVDALMSDDIRSTLKRKAAIAVRTYTLNNFTQEGLVNIYARFQELDKTAGDAGSKDTFLQTVNLVLGKLPWAGGDGIVRPDNMEPGKVSASLKVEHPLLEHYDNLNAELRTEELIAAASGREPTSRAAIEDMKFPEPLNDKPKAQ